MTKWADYLISKVSYTHEKNGKNNILEVKIHEDNGMSISNGEIWVKKDVIEKMEEGYSFKIMILKNDGGNVESEKVRKIKIRNNYYLRTDANIVEEDNLGNLPLFG